MSLAAAAQVKVTLIEQHSEHYTNPTHWSLQNFWDGNDTIVGASKIARDVTEIKLLERQWRQSQKMEAIGQLTSGIAHDFNNLLAIVIGNLGLMERLVAGNEEAIKRLRPAQKAASRDADLTRRLLALASKEDLNPANTRIEDAIRDTVELAGRALGPEIRIVTNFDPSVPAVFVDGAGLESALLNLAVNARDAMPKGGTLTFGTKLTELDDSFPSVRTRELQPGAYARISVSDTGEGMSKETLERALEPFFTTKGREKGTGLGLAMVYGFARQSGGTVRLYSELGYGTTVTLYLPLAGEFVPAVPEISTSHVSVHGGGTVLLVDDETELLEIAQAYLTEMGYSAMRADNAASALNALAIYKEIDLMITDIIMPGGMNGVELAKKARELSPKLKVIYSSGYPSDSLVERSGTSVDGPLLRKPYHRSEFATMIQRTLDGQAT
jgi:signal transduction histidine kinase/CheY-like chemotaxis protein